MEKVRLIDLERHPDWRPVARRLRDLFRTADEAERWLNSSHEYLRGATPASFFLDGRVVPILEMLEEERL